jgi:hypothetical protein
MNVPLFAPSVALLARWEVARHVVAERVYWPGAPLDAKWPPHPFAPNERRDPAAVAYWLKFCDIYTFPHVLHFDSWEHLLDLLERTDLAAVSARMAAENGRILAALQVQWAGLFKRMFGGGGGGGGGASAGGGGAEEGSGGGIEPGGRVIPADFDTAMRAAYGETLSAEEPPCERVVAPEMANANLKYQWQPQSPFRKKWR